ncbi:hypothetical protein HPP92_023152 [Vanilla planifolia]|uniref:Uncharacterized protein n=1 Tax=Vanilla planifolia TaxID=51239 RepID=A0A835PQF0_VANPL|nr:hypothetical protein HPP92_023472 [Vanilla planifolia]KAG0460024.1 hypothetical protein HPP92_023152 [Vanilla planifolia]
MRVAMVRAFMEMDDPEKAVFANVAFHFSLKLWFAAQMSAEEKLVECTHTVEALSLMLSVLYDTLIGEDDRGNSLSVSVD